METNMKKTALAAAILLASGASQAATLNADSTYNIAINTSGSCFAFGDCTTLVENVSPGGVLTSPSPVQQTCHILAHLAVCLP